MQATQDKAGKTYWDQVWQNAALPKAVNPRQPGVRYYVHRRFHDYFAATFGVTGAQGKRLLEIGCARSSWLPYFAQQFGFQVAGLDYSEIGCQQSRQILAREGVEGEIVQADFFHPPGRLLGTFDVVVSFGVAEHFANTAECIAAFSRFLKPGGVMITITPNMRGAIGFLQCKLNAPVFQLHVPVGPRDLQAAHEQAGLNVRQAHYYLSTGFNIVNLNGHKPRGLGFRIKSWLLLALRCCSKAVWAFEEKVLRLPASAAASPFVVCVAQKS